ncbi:MAG: AmmeMemoRadiSam system protein B [Anaerolineae bacterium]
MVSPTRSLPEGGRLERAARVRHPAVAGQFYPSQPAKLRSAIRRYLDEATSPMTASWRAVIVPHAGYMCSGRTAAHGFKVLAALPPAEYTIFLLGPAHWLQVEGVGLSSAAEFETPLGSAPVAADCVVELLSLGRPYTLTDAAHAPEHSLEVELPFLQTALATFDIVPMLVGPTVPPTRVADDLLRLMVALPNPLLVVSSDLSHYHRWEDASRLDRAFLQAVIDQDVEAVSRGEACGLPGILTVMHIARRLGWRASLLAYANSGDTCGTRDAVVGYGAVAYSAS